MTDTLAPLILDLLEWIATKPRSYSEVMEAWRTSCPRLPLWEEANDRGFVVQSREAGQEPTVNITSSGRRFLRESGRSMVHGRLRVDL